MNEVCVDSNVAVKWVVFEEDHDKAKALFEEWKAKKVRIVAPSFFPVEAESVIRRKVAVDKTLTEDEGDKAVRVLRKFPVEIITLPGQLERAWELAKELDRPVVYDTYYLALAEMKGCEFWTADERLHNVVKGKLDFVRFLKNYTKSSEPFYFRSGCP